MISFPIVASSRTMSAASSFSLLRNSLTLRAFQNAKTSSVFSSNLARQTFVVLPLLPQRSHRGTSDQSFLLDAKKSQMLRRQIFPVGWKEVSEAQETSDSALSVNNAEAAKNMKVRWLHTTAKKVTGVLRAQHDLAIEPTSATNDEEVSARAAAASADSGAPTIFDKIIAKEIPSTIVYEDEKVLAFKDINPQAPVHVLVIPKCRDGLTRLSKAVPRHSEILGNLLYAAKIVAEKEGILDGFRVVINDGPSACQSVYHLHLHVLGGRQMKWPPG